MSLERTVFGKLPRTTHKSDHHPTAFEGIDLWKLPPTRPAEIPAVESTMPIANPVAPGWPPSDVAPAEDTRYLRTGPRLVVGIDYGTTNTGLAWLHITSDTPKASNIQILTSWIGGNTTKVPSIISYSPSTTGGKQWGYDISDGSEIISWTKLELQPKPRAVELTRLLETVRGLPLTNKLRNNPSSAVESTVPVHLGFGPTDIVADFLKKVTRYWFDHMQAQAQSVLRNVPIDVVVTHPGCWSYEAKNQTVRAVRRAFPAGLFPTLRDIALFSEPEACALYTALTASSVDRCRLQNGDCFTVCDAGGGTIDLISYQLVSKRPFEIKPLTAAAGDECGASTIDRAFMKFLTGIVEFKEEAPLHVGTGGHNVVRKIEKLLLQRFTSVKHVFGEPGPSRGDITLPKHCRVLDTEFAKSRVSAPTGATAPTLLRLKHEDLVEMFEPSVSQTINLLARQRAQVLAKTLSVTHIFMSGGFANSPYLFARVSEWAREWNIEVERGDDSWGAVVRGAVLKGARIEASPSAPLRFCPRSYGISVSKFYRDYNYKDRSETQIMWLVRKGDYIPDDKPIEQTYDVHCCWSSADYSASRELRVDFVATADDKLPASIVDLSELDERIVLSSNYASIPKQTLKKGSTASLIKGQFSEAIVHVMLSVHGLGPRIKLTCGGKDLAPEKRTSL